MCITRISQSKPFILDNINVRLGCVIMSKYENKELMKAIKNNDIDSVKKLIKEGVNLNIRYEKWNNETPLEKSIKLGNNEIAELLLENGASVNNMYFERDGIQKFFWTTPLHEAVLRGNYDIVKKLIECKAPLDIRKYGNTALNIAINKGYKEIAKLLIRSGANYNIEGCDFVDNKFKKGITAFELAKKAGNEDILKLIKEKENERKQKEEKNRNDFIKEVTDKLTAEQVIFSNEAVKTYVDIKMGKDVNIESINDKELEHLLNIYNCKNKVKDRDDEPKITKKELMEMEKDTPIFIRGLSRIRNNIYRIHNETGGMWEIRKLLRKKGKYHQCFSMINYGKIYPYKDVGYGVIENDMKNIRVASEVDMYSLYEKKEKITSVGSKYYTSKYRDRENMPINEKLRIMLINKRKQRRVTAHDEIIMDVADKNIKFIFWTGDSEDRFNKLNSLYFQRKYKELTGRTLPIFRYKPGDKNYLEETHFTNKEIVDMLKDEYIDLAELDFIDLAELDFFITFKDEIDQIPELCKSIQNFIKDTIDFYKDDRYKDDLYKDDLYNDDKKKAYILSKYLRNPWELINFVKYVGAVQGEEAKKECIKQMFNVIDMTILQLLYTAENWHTKGKNRTGIVLELLAEVKALETDDLKDFLEPKLKNVIASLNAELKNVNKHFKYHDEYHDLIRNVNKSISKNSEGGYTQLTSAIKRGDIKKSISKNSEEGYTQLTYAIKRGDLKMTRMLLEQNANVNSKDINGRLPITLAVELGNMNMVKLLVNEFNAKINEKDGLGRTAMDVARKHWNFKIKCFLIKHKADCRENERRINNLLRLNKRLKNKIYKILRMPKKIFIHVKKYIFKNTDRIKDKAKKNISDKNISM